MLSKKTFMLHKRFNVLWSDDTYRIIERLRNLIIIINIANLSVKITVNRIVEI